MKTFERLVVITLLGCRVRRGRADQHAEPDGARALRTKPPSASSATNDLMVDRQIKRWLKTHYPGWDAEPHEFQELGIERYAVVYITSTNNPGRRVYFRVMKFTRTKTTPGSRSRIADNPQSLASLLRCDCTR